MTVSGTVKDKVYHIVLQWGLHGVQAKEIKNSLAKSGIDLSTSEVREVLLELKAEGKVEN